MIVEKLLLKITFIAVSCRDRARALARQVESITPSAGRKLCRRLPRAAASDCSRPAAAPTTGILAHRPLPDSA